MAPLREAGGPVLTRPRPTSADEAALGELFWLHGGRLRSVALLLTDDPAGVEGLVRTAFVRLARRGRLARDPQRAASWLVEAVVDDAGGSPGRSLWQRLRHARPLRSPAVGPVDGLGGETDPVWRAITHLPRPQREALVLHVVWAADADPLTAGALRSLARALAAAPARATEPTLEQQVAEAVTGRIDQEVVAPTAQQWADVLRAVREDRRRRRTRVIGVVGVTTLALAAVLTADGWGRGADQEGPTPAPVPGVSSAERTAAGFVEAYLAFDRADAAGYLAPGADLEMTNFLAGPRWWRRLNRFDEATGLQVVGLGQCRETGTGDAGTTVLCPYVFDQYGAGRLGLGPFGDTYFEVVVRDTFVVNADIITSSTLNGLDRLTTSLDEWLAETHPEDAELLAAWRSDDASPALVDRSLRRWRTVTEEYVAAVQAGELVGR